MAGCVSGPAVPGLLNTEKSGNTRFMKSVETGCANQSPVKQCRNSEAASNALNVCTVKICINFYWTIKVFIVFLFFLFFLFFYRQRSENISTYFQNKRPRFKHFSQSWDIFPLFISLASSSSRPPPESSWNEPICIGNKMKWSTWRLSGVIIDKRSVMIVRFLQCRSWRCI